ncbi:MAG TPA: pyrroline-5-carboxylate reductase [Elusimicrobiota bacterium]|nr:pyrroline-5-carboxylate reductase [Elusimicrobiota bacterium]
MRSREVCFIGGGNMGEALMAGILSSRLVSPSRVLVTDVRPGRLAQLKRKYGVGVGVDNATAAASSRIVVLCVKPQQMESILKELGPVLRSDQLVVSVAAGVRTGRIERALRKRVPVIRVMPNTPALLGVGALVYCRGRFVRKSHEVWARRLLGSSGRVWTVREKAMDAVTALSGSGPAYVFYVAECMAAAGRRLGLAGALAESLARQTVFGAGTMLSRTQDPASVLRARVTSPGGTTAEAIQVFESLQMRKMFLEAMTAAARRSRRLSGK